MTTPIFPLISVVMSVYNGEKYLVEAIDSVLSQSYNNFEFIIINDGSTDSSIDIINEYANKDNRIVVIDRENKGLPYSLNEGITKAKGEYIARMDADDICLPDRFEKQLKYINENNLDLCGTFIEKFGDNIKNHILKHPLEHNDIKFRLLFTSSFAHPTVMIKKEVFHKVQYKSIYKVAQDYQLWVDIVNAEFKVGNLPEVLLKYRVHEEQASIDKLKIQKATAKEISHNFSRTLSQEQFSIISRYIELKKNPKISLKELNSLLFDFHKLGKNLKVSENFLATELKQLYILSMPKSPLRYLIYRNRTQEFKKNQSDELKILIRSIVMVDEDSKTFKILRGIARKLNL